MGVLNDAAHRNDLRTGARCIHHVDDGGCMLAGVAGWWPR